MFKGKFIALSLIAAALLCWQILPATVDTVVSGIVDPCSSTATSAGGCWMICPAGDGQRLEDIGATISLTMRDNTGAPIPGIHWSDFWVIGCADELVLCGGSGAGGASATTDENGQTTIEGTTDGSGCAIPGIAVVCQGIILADPDNCTLDLCLAIRTTSPDCRPVLRDLIVDGIDFSYFGQVFMGTLPMDLCVDFNCDDACDLIDFARFGQHWLHECP